MPNEPVAAAEVLLHDALERAAVEEARAMLEKAFGVLRAEEAPDAEEQAQVAPSVERCQTARETEPCQDDAGTDHHAEGIAAPQRRILPPEVEDDEHRLDGQQCQRDSIQIFKHPIHAANVSLRVSPIPHGETLKSFLSFF